MLSLGSCNEELKSVSTNSITVSNYYIPDNTEEPITVQHGCTYNMVFDNVSSKMTFAATGIKLPGQSEQVMTSKEFKFDRLAYGSSETSLFHNGNATLGNGMPVSQITGYVTNMVNYEAISPDPFYNFTPNPMIVVSYRVGDYLVRTFARNAYFSGTTNTYFKMPGAESASTYTTKECTYRVNFSEDMKSANIMLYNVKFAENMKPIQAVILKSLPVALTREGYVIEGTDVVPEMMEAGEATPFPSKIFNNIQVKSTPDMRTIKCEYLVAGMFHGAFEGISCDYFDY